VKAKLRECKYHILHYAGHGSYNELSPEKSCLYFWEKENRQGQVRQMRTSELKLLVENSALRFVYLSCCSSFQSGNAGQLLENDFLGVADGLVYAGVPAVLGFRWPIHDEGAKCLALAFYQSLFEQGNLDAALLHARREIAMADKDDQTWISPVLIVQK
jgi:CHAT domain-containing protein